MLANRSWLGAVLILGAAGLLAGRGTWAAQTPFGAAGPVARDATTSDATSMRITSQTDLRRASRLIGKPLKNTEGVTLGKVDDLVLTPELNNVSYAVLTRGGLFGLGERRYAIPWSAMRAGVGDTIVAPIDKAELKQDRGFRGNLWPSEGDPRWLGRPGERTERVTFDVQPAAEQKDIRRRRVTNVLGTRVRDLQDERVGRVRDMLVALDSGEIPFTIVSYGGLLGLGNRYTAVPADAIEFRPAEDLAYVRVSEQILRANSFTPGDFPDLSDPVYAQRIYAAYDVRPQDPDWVVLGYIPPATRARPRAATPLQPQATLPGQTQTQTQTRIPLPGDQQAALPDGTAIPGSIRTEYLAAFTPDKLRTIEGVVTGVSSFQLVGTQSEWVQLQVRTDDGELVTVHLGPRDYVSRQDFYVASNDRITLTGAQATAWRQPIILPITATVGTTTITLRDQTGHPLWDKILPQNQPQEQQPTPDPSQQPSDQQPQPGETQPQDPSQQPQPQSQGQPQSQQPNPAQPQTPPQQPQGGATPQGNPQPGTPGNQ